MRIQFNSPLARFKCENVGQASSYSECLDGNSYISGNSVIELLRLNKLEWYEELLGLLAFLIIIRVFAYYGLRRSSKK